MSDNSLPSVISDNIPQSSAVNQSITENSAARVDTSVVSNEQEILKKNIEEQSKMTQFLEKINNPHPILIAVITAGLIALAYFIYVMFIKPSVEGYWYSIDLVNTASPGEIYKIKASKLSRNFEITKNKELVAKGKLCGCALVRADSSKNIMIWDYGNRIDSFTYTTEPPNHVVLFRIIGGVPEAETDSWVRKTYNV